MTQKAITVLGILAIMLMTMFGTVAAQDENPETPPPSTETVQPGTKFFTHPVVTLLSAYFDRETGDDETPVNPEDVETPEPDETDNGLGPVGEEIAAYHEEGMGFGVLVKIYAMVEASEQACAAVEEGDVTEEEGCTPLTADELITAFKGGTGLGVLFKEHGKPALLGVGHVKNELKKMENQPVDETEENESELDTKNNKPDKVKKDKPNKGKGPNK
jgi:hypothetical protein